MHVQIAQILDLKSHPRRYRDCDRLLSREGAIEGKPYEYHDRLTDVWMKEAGKWQIGGVALQRSSQAVILLTNL